MNTDDMGNYRRAWVRLISGCCIFAGAIQIATAQASLAWGETTSPMKRRQQALEPGDSLDALPQQAGDFITLKKALAMGYEVKAVFRDQQINPKDPKDVGADILYLQKGPSLLVCVGPQRITTPEEEQPHAVCTPPPYLRD